MGTKSVYILAIVIAVFFVGSAIAAVLEITPLDDFEPSGMPSGPFTPSSIDYQLTNTGPNTIWWGAYKEADWLDIVPEWGPLGPGTSTVVTVALTSGANSLPEGVYTDTLVFLDITNEQEQTRGVTLTISLSGGIWAVPGSFDVNIVEGTTLTRTLTIGNDGLDDLNFLIRTRVVSNTTTSEQELDSVSVTGKEQNSSIQKEQDFTVAGNRPFKPGELIVRFASDAYGIQRSKDEKNQILSSLGTATIKRNFMLVPGLSLVKLPQGLTVEEALPAFNKTNGILYAHPNYELKICSTFPDDPKFNELWGMHNTGQTGGTQGADIDAPQAWDIATDSSEISVAVIDTGVDYTHPDLAANMWVNEDEFNGIPGVDDDGNGFIDDIYGYDFCNNDGNPMDDHYHGTHCAGTIGAVGNNNEGVTGVCWNVRIMALKFLDSGGSGTTSDAISCVEYSILMGANLSSNSWGGGDYSQGLKDVIDAAGAAGMLFISSAGNDGTNNDNYPHYPSSYDCESLISVLATNHNDDKSGFSNYGPISVDLGAPGSSILSCEPGNSYQYLSGTSMASPHVAGACALLWSINPMLSNMEVKDILLQTVDKTLPGYCVSEGRLNLYSAVLETKAPWLEIEPEEGTVGPGDSNQISVTFNAMTIEPGAHEAEILVLSNDPCRPTLLIPVTMTVNPDALVVTPAEDFESSGTKNGPFEPQCLTYTMTNNGTESLDWNADWTENWLNVTPYEGTLEPNVSMNVYVCIDPNAELLEPNIYTDMITFQNLVSESVKLRSATLIVKPPDCFTESFDSGSDLGFLSLTFIPDGSIAYYEACREKISEFPTDPNGAAYISLGDDDFEEVIINDGKEILFFGQWYDRFYIGSNGYITFGQGDIEYIASLEEHFNLPRISALFTDLTPVNSQSISYMQLNDRMVVTFQNVPLYGDKTATNSFQVEMFFVDGTMCISWLGIEAQQIIVGLSEGSGLPPAFFVESDMSNYPPCWPSGDFDRDYFVNFMDFAVLAMHWLDEVCGIPMWCDKTDLDFSSMVDITDVGIFSENWLVKEDWWLQPLSHWKFDEGEGDIAYDSIGNNHGTVYGATWTTGQIDGALDFDGISDYVEVPDDPSLRFNQYDSFSMSYWAMPLPGAANVIGKYRKSVPTGVFGYHTGWYSDKSAFNFVVEKSRVGYINVVTPDNSAPSGNWFFVTAVYNNKDVKIYLNGEIGGSGTFIYDTGDTTPDNNLTIGVRAWESTKDLYFNGTIDDVRLYNRALSAEEIWQLYQQGL